MINRESSVHAGEQLISRLLPKYVDLFHVEHLLIEHDKGFYDQFQLETKEQANGKYSYKIVLRGNNAISIASALNYYLKYYCNSQFYWGADHIDIPSNPPRISEKITKRTQHKYRYYMNTCTHGYSTVWWDWARWEREIDWMALNGINAPLSFTGQEYVWQQVYGELNISTSNFFSGPAFLPWNRMGNLNGWSGPPSQHWIASQFNLAKQILQRERELGMTPILPAFAGYVPPDFINQYKHANVSRLKPWAQSFEGTLFLDPLDEMFQKLGNLYIEKQTSLLGSDHLYNADPFNEEIPPTTDIKYLADVSKAIFKSIMDADSKAIWVMQGWFLVNDKSFWQPPQAKAFFDAIPQDRSIVLDLWAEVAPVWKTTQSFYGHQFIWCMLHNFGGRPGLYGKLHTMPQDLVKTKMNNKNMIGIGLSPEAIENNPIAYDLLLEMTWRSDVPDLNTFTNQYISTRYGNPLPENVIQSWKYLIEGVYNCPTNQMGASGSIVAARPALDVTYVSNAPVSLYFNKTQLIEAWGLFIRSDSLSKTRTYQYDLVDIGMQSLSAVALSIYYKIQNSYRMVDLHSFESFVKQFDQIMYHMDELCATNENFLLGTWLQSSIKWASNEQEKQMLELNAKLQITSWAKPELSDDLTQYAYKLWSGIIKDFYMPRWSIFYDYLKSSMEHGKPIDAKEMKEEIILVEKKWISERKVYSTKISGDVIEVSKKLYRWYKDF
ncbi:alpha-N-acetylglucosaminidase [Acrasis kona]|uniref:Alpha-N-acetylglucosaminidase n=1 Tax=Acrasis kona TaxID=1008807 RepID=A0AAW2Z5R0_9EUKA